MERTCVRGVGDGEERRDAEQDEGEHPAHPRERDEHGEHAALPECVAPKEVAPECLQEEQAMHEVLNGYRCIGCEDSPRRSQRRRGT